MDVSGWTKHGHIRWPIHRHMSYLYRRKFLRLMPHWPFPNALVCFEVIQSQPIAISVDIHLS